ncbi:hypothetical protein HWV62_2846 [Athelia sp. TMB]|nr:hypothetical protein HWV62_2846 [Athelia sp. TMB]
MDTRFQEKPNEQTADELSRPDTSRPQAQALFKKLSILDRLLTPAILVCMIIGVIIGVYTPNVQEAFDTVRFQSVSVRKQPSLSVAESVPNLPQVQYEAIPKIFSSRRIWIHIGMSLFLNWIVGPFIMLGLAWATLPDLPTYRTGVIMVGLARCIAMVLIWNRLAGGDENYCAILVVINSVLQIVLYSPYALLFVNVIGGAGEQGVHVTYGNVAISVLIYLGIPLVAGVATRYAVWYFTSKEFLNTRFLPWFSPLALLGLLYTIIVMFAYQGHHIVHNIGPVFRVFVPMILYFTIMWFGSFFLVLWLSRREAGTDAHMWGYEMAVVQSFTAGSNNFVSVSRRRVQKRLTDPARQELAIAVTIAVYSVGSDQALAATIGPLIEVPVLLALTWVSLFLGDRLRWTTRGSGGEGKPHSDACGA